MSESQSQNTGIDVNDLLELDSYVKDREAMSEALGNKMDNYGDDEQIEQAAIVLFGREVDQAVDSAKEGEPGFVYAEARRKIRATLEASLRKVPPQPSEIVKTLVKTTDRVNEDEDMVTRPIPIQKALEGEWRQSL